MCQIFDEFDNSVFIDDTDLQDDIEKIERNKPFPKPWDEDNFIAKYLMQFPVRFDNLWVLKPINELLNYSYRFNRGAIRPKYFEDYCIRPQFLKEMDRPYTWFLNDVLLGNEPLFVKTDVNKEDGVDDFFHESYPLVDKIIADGDIHYCDLWRCKITHFDIEEENKLFILTTRDIPLWLSFLKSNVPIRLVPDNKMPKVNLPRTQSRKDDDYLRTMETLGVYTHTGNKVEILLCPKRIRECANEMNINPEWLFVIVYLHELAHAALDPSIDIKKDLFSETYILDDKVIDDKVIKVLSTSANDPSAFVMEESLANMIMLLYIDWYSEIEDGFSSMIDEAIRFVDRQTVEYSFGKQQFYANVDWTKWRNYKMEHEESEAQLRDWYNKCFIEGHKEIYSKEMFDEIMGSYQD